MSNVTAAPANFSTFWRFDTFNAMCPMVTAAAVSVPCIGTRERLSKKILLEVQNKKQRALEKGRATGRAATKGTENDLFLWERQADHLPLNLSLRKILPVCVWR